VLSLSFVADWLSWMFWFQGGCYWLLQIRDRENWERSKL